MVNTKEKLQQLYPVTNEIVYKYLSTEFRPILTLALKRSIDLEQGLTLSFTPQQKFHVTWSKEIGPDYARVEKVNNDWLPIGWLHVHPINDLESSHAYIPSPEDLSVITQDDATMKDGEDNEHRVGVFDSLIVRGTRPLSWAWIPSSLTSRQINRIYRYWKQGSQGRLINCGDYLTRELTHSDMDDLESDLKEEGIKIERAELSGDIAGSFANLVRKLPIRFGIQD